MQETFFKGKRCYCAEDCFIKHSQPANENNTQAFARTADRASVCMENRCVQTFEMMKEVNGGSASYNAESSGF